MRFRQLRQETSSHRQLSGENLRDALGMDAEAIAKRKDDRGCRRLNMVVLAQARNVGAMAHRGAALVGRGLLVPDPALRRACRSRFPCDYSPRTGGVG
jgi:hypothetical protein